MPTVDHKFGLSDDHRKQLEAVKEWGKKNWKPFVAGAAVATVTFYIFRGRSSVPTINNIVNNTPVFNNIITIKQEIGRPPNLVHDITTGLYYGSQGKAAAALGVSDSTMSQHLNGRAAHAAGHILERVITAE